MADTNCCAEGCGVEYCGAPYISNFDDHVLGIGMLIVAILIAVSIINNITLPTDGMMNGFTYP
jgi:hypothetical protein